ncbi:RNA recognition motif domain-containing protein [Candidatus Nitrospira neomarina]|uniref:RNA-binding protein n=1 Tax=Candidatus Nitrospira neomarina TaxID=3020899 RepID=A0AA96GJ09_9BACT|nr:RNA-binding protein [Candidatus Nitrospira neomarina]WNM62303.1 RNA-binding protein [Candidatus Nitrospira neomarina]
MNLKMFVGGLPFAMTDAQLRELFAPYGVVKSAQVIMDKMTGRSRGFGFVEMSTDEEVQAAIAAWNDKVYEGRTLLVNEAKPRMARTGSGSAPRW